jgi:hypothetical protein
MAREGSAAVAIDTFASANPHANKMTTELMQRWKVDMANALLSSSAEFEPTAGLK